MKTIKALETFKRKVAKLIKEQRQAIEEHETA